MPSGEKLPESFFSALYADLAVPEAEPEPLKPGTDSSRLARMIEAWPGAVFCLDTELQCRLANRAGRSWCLPLGRQALEEQGRCRLDELWPAELLDLLLPGLSAALQGQESRVQEQASHPRRGTQTLAVRVQPDIEDGRVVGVFVHLDEVAPVRPLEATAQRSDAAPPSPAMQLGQLAERLQGAALFLLDASGRVSDWPASAERLLGHGAEQAHGRPLADFDAPEGGPESPDSPQALERATFLGQYDSSGWRVRADGSRFWSRLELTALHQESGRLSGYACLLQDMTELKRLEDLLRQWNQTLELRVEERTSELHAINQDLESFSYSVSHDLRAPLRHILSFVDLLREDLEAGEAQDLRRHIDTIADSAQHMGRLIEGLLAFSRLGRAPLQRREVAMGALLQSSLNRVQHDPALQRPDGEVVWQIAPDWPRVAGDTTLLSLVWDNLLSNALKYSRPSRPARIVVDWKTDTDGHLVFQVRDNGVGFDPRRADRLFGVFQRLHRSKDFEGTGIGLALCRRVIERHGGRIWAESLPGEGSLFGFALPAGLQPGSDAG